MDYDPNAPAFGEQAQLAEAPEAKTEVKAPIEEKVESKSIEPSEEESKVPYSRFKKFHDEAKRYQAEAEEWKAKAEAVKAPAEVQDDLPDFWKELYGDSDASKKAWKLQSQQNSQLMDQARREAVEAVRAEARAESERVEKNLETIDEKLDGLQEIAGHELSETEQSAILDIVDEYSPKDDDGNYLAMIPFEKAWGIYEMQQEKSTAKKVQSRNQVANLTNTKSQGQISPDTEKDKSWIPGWDNYKNRI